jgi:hypothetical protein
MSEASSLGQVKERERERKREKERQKQTRASSDVCSSLAPQQEPLLHRAQLLFETMKTKKREGSVVKLKVKLKESERERGRENGIRTPTKGRSPQLSSAPLARPCSSLSLSLFASQAHGGRWRYRGSNGQERRWEWMRRVGLGGKLKRRRSA